MSKPDLNLLVTLEALLAEGSVVGAARLLHLSPSAMSRALARLRQATGDPLLVRAGRQLVPTPRAVELAGQVGQLVHAAEAALSPAKTLDLKTLVRTFTLRNRDGFVENFGAALIARVEREAPGVQLHFVAKPDKDSTPLRDGSIDLETGVIGDTTGPEVRTQALFRDRFVGVVRNGHELCGKKITPERYAAGRHVVAARRRTKTSPIEIALEKQGLDRKAVTLVPSFSEALTLARGSDLIATVPHNLTRSMRTGLCSFGLPFALPEIAISLLWHPRMDADPAHRWLRGCVRAVCLEQFDKSGQE